MKQYVLDEPGARPPTAASPEPARRGWRWAILLPAVAAVALVGLYSVVEGRPDPSTRPVEAAVVPAYVASTAVADPARAAAPPEIAPMAPGIAPVAAQPLPSRITRTDGRYVVDLHSAAIGPALEMLSQATRTSVTGGDVVLHSPSRITRSFIADTPLEVWKGVFGDLASYALTCGHSTCAVRFVSLVGAPATPVQSLAPMPVQKEEEAQPAQAPQTRSLAPPGTPSTADASTEQSTDN